MKLTNYNKECESYESEKISLDNFTESDADGDGKVSLFEFCEHIYHKIIQRELGAEPRKIFDMQNEMEKAKKTYGRNQAGSRWRAIARRNGGFRN